MQECYHDCQTHHCPFVADTHDPNRYVCLRCGRERNVDRFNGIGSFFALFITSIILAVIFS